MLALVSCAQFKNFAFWRVLDAYTGEPVTIDGKNQARITSFFLTSEQHLVAAWHKCFRGKSSKSIFCCFTEAKQQVQNTIQRILGSPQSLKKMSLAAFIASPTFFPGQGVSSITEIIHRITLAYDVLPYENVFIFLFNKDETPKLNRIHAIANSHLVYFEELRTTYSLNKYNPGKYDKNTDKAKKDERNRLGAYRKEKVLFRDRMLPNNAYKIHSGKKNITIYTPHSPNWKSTDGTIISEWGEQWTPMRMNPFSIGSLGVGSSDWYSIGQITKLQENGVPQDRLTEDEFQLLNEKIKLQKKERRNCDRSEEPAWKRQKIFGEDTLGNIFNEDQICEEEDEDYNLTENDDLEKEYEFLEDDDSDDLFELLKDFIFEKDFPTIEEVTSVPATAHIDAVKSNGKRRPRSGKRGKKMSLIRFSSGIEYKEDKISIERIQFLQQKYSRQPIRRWESQSFALAVSPNDC